MTDQNHSLEKVFSSTWYWHKLCYLMCCRSCSIILDS